MTRSEVIDTLRSVYKTMGFRGLAAVGMDIVKHGPLHDPEFLTCAKCGGEFERPVAQMGSLPRYCLACDIHNARRRRS